MKKSSRKKTRSKAKQSPADIYYVETGTLDDIYLWITQKHYAKRMPLVQLAYILWHRKSKVAKGVCTFSPPARALNNATALFDKESNLSYPCYGLSRLVVDEGLGKNTLSWFLGSVLRLLPSPAVIVSYADPNQGHHGYIYQATNWIYTGKTGKRRLFFNTASGKEMHERTVVGLLGSSSAASLPENIEIQEQDGKHRYLMLLGPRKIVAFMGRHLILKSKKYPKGENKRYDASYQPPLQIKLF